MFNTIRKINKFQPILVLLIYSLIVSCNDSDKNIVKTGLEGKSMPQFSVLALDKTTKIDMAKRSTNKPYVIFSFAPWCPYCKAQTEELVKKVKSFDNVDIYMLSVSSIPELASYAKRYELEKYKNITMVQDTGYNFITYFNTSAVPYFAIFDKNNKLKRVFEGKSSVESIQNELIITAL